MTHRHQIVSQFAAEISPLGAANFLYADGDAFFAHGNKRTQPTSGKVAPPGLYWLNRQCAPESAYDIPGLHVDSEDQHVVLVASVPLSDEGWVPLDEGEVLCIQNGALTG